MPSFTPTTYDGPTRMAGRELNHRSIGTDMWRHFRQLAVGFNVLITAGVANASPGATSVDTQQIEDADSSAGGEGGKAWFRGGLTYTVTAAEDTILTAAGYTVT